MKISACCEKLEKKTEELVTQFNNLEMLINMMPQPFAHHEIVCDEFGTPIDYRFLKVNAAFERLICKQSSEIVGKTVLEILPETESVWIQKYGDVALKGEIVEFAEFSAALNKNFDVVAYSPQKGFFTVIANDITDEIQAKTDLARSQERFKRLIETTKTIPWEFDLVNGEFTYVGNQIESILGFPTSTWKTLDDWAETVHPEDRENAVRYCSTETRAKRDHTFEYRVIAANGEIRWLLNDVNVQVEDDVPVRLSGFMVDVSECRESKQKLQESEETLQRILDSTFEGLYGVNKEGKCVYINQAAQKILGYGETSILGFNPHQIISHTSSDGSSIDQQNCLVTKVLQTGQPIYQPDEILWKSDGDYLNVECRIEPIKEGVDTIGSVVTFNDISDRKKMIEQQIISNQMSSLGELAAGVAHEINNPISGVINYADMLLDKKIKVRDPDLLLRNIIKEGERVASIVRNLLEFATNDREKCGPVSILKVVSNTIELMQKLLYKDNIIIDTHLDESIPHVYGNEQKLEQVLMNLISNARYALNKKYRSTDPNKLLRIASAYVEEGDYKSVQLIVWDKGCGISKENLKKVFAKFFTTKQSGEGTGLGLPIVYDILKDCNATIQIESEEHFHTKVTLNFSVFEA